MNNPYPYKCILSKKINKWYAYSDRFTFIKDTRCSLLIIERRLELSKGIRLHLTNFNSQTFLTSLQADYQAYSEVISLSPSKLYVWLYENWTSKPEKSALLFDFLSTTSMIESLNYPTCDKYHQRLISNFNTLICRINNSCQFKNSFFYSAVKSMSALRKKMKNLAFIRLIQLNGINICLL